MSIFRFDFFHMCWNFLKTFLNWTNLNRATKLFWKMVSGLFKPSLNIIFCRIFEQILLLKVFLFVYYCLPFKRNFNNSILYSILRKIFIGRMNWVQIEITIKMIRKFLLHSWTFTVKMKFFFRNFRLSKKHGCSFRLYPIISKDTCKEKTL